MTWLHLSPEMSHLIGFIHCLVNYPVRITQAVSCGFDPGLIPSTCVWASYAHKYLPAPSLGLLLIGWEKNTALSLAIIYAFHVWLAPLKPSRPIRVRAGSCSRPITILGLHYAIIYEINMFQQKCHVYGVCCWANELFELLADVNGIGEDLSLL